MDFLSILLSFSLMAVSIFFWMYVQKSRRAIAQLREHLRTVYEDGERFLSERVLAEQVRIAETERQCALAEEVRIAETERQRIKTENKLLRKLLSRNYVEARSFEVICEQLKSSLQNAIQELNTCREERDHFQYLHKLVASMLKSKKEELVKALQKISSLELDLVQADASIQEAMQELVTSREEYANLQIAVNWVFNPVESIITMG